MNLRRLLSLRLIEPTPDDDLRWVREQLRAQRDELMMRRWWRLSEAERGAVVDLTRTIVALHDQVSDERAVPISAMEGAARTARSAARSRDRREAALE